MFRTQRFRPLHFRSVTRLSTGILMFKAFRPTLICGFVASSVSTMLDGAMMALGHGSSSLKTVCLNKRLEALIYSAVLLQASFSSLHTRESSAACPISYSRRSC